MKPTITPETIRKLRDLQKEEKFAEEDFYSGAPDEIIRSRCESSVNSLLESIITEIRLNSQKDFVINEFTETLADFDEEDTEERERACAYLEQIMTIVGIDSSDGKLNKWLYGFDPNE